MKKIILSLFLVWVFLFGFWLVNITSAFTGPISNPPSGSGIIKYDGSSNISVPAGLGIGTTVTQTSSTRLYIQGDDVNPSSVLFRIDAGFSAFGTPSVVALNNNDVYFGTSSFSGNPAPYTDSGLSRVFVNGLFAANWVVGSQIDSYGNISASGTITASGGFIGGGSTGAEDVSSGIFGDDTGGGNYSFPASLGIATTTTVNLPEELSIYGDSYISGKLGVGGAPSSSVVALNVAGSISGPILGFGALDIQRWSINVLDWSTFGQQYLHFFRSGFVVPHLTLADVSGESRVGIVSAFPGYTLDVGGTLGATTSTLSGSLVFSNSNVGIKFGDGTVQTSAAAAGSGSQNYIAKWSSGDQLGNSIIYDSGSNVGIGTNNPSAKLQIVQASGTNLLRLGTNSASGYNIDLYIAKGYNATGSSLCDGAANSSNTTCLAAFDASGADKSCSYILSGGEGTVLCAKPY